jgi:hypothetical protein
MNYKLLVHCTKEHLEIAKYCQIDKSKHFHISSDSPNVNCWIAVALHDIFPMCSVDFNYVSNSIRKIKRVDKEYWQIDLPGIATENIGLFDSARTIEKRMKLEPFSFEIEFSQETFEAILRCNGFKCQQDFFAVCKKVEHLTLTEC